MNKNGHTHYDSAFELAISMTNGRPDTEKAIIFLTDGVPDGGYEGTDEQFEALKNNGVTSMYEIAYRLSNVPQVLYTIRDKFENGDVYEANTENLSEKFEDIVYRINQKTAEMPGSTDRLNITDATISPQKPLTIEIQKGTYRNVIEVTEISKSNTSIIYEEQGNVYLNILALLNECGFTDFGGININVEYWE